MIKVLICDYVGYGKQWFENCANSDGVEVTKVIVPSDTEPDKLIAETGYDYLLIFEAGLRNMFNSMVKFLNIPEGKIIFALDFASWLKHPSAIFSIIDPQKMGGGGIWRAFNLNLGKSFNDFIACTVEGVHYVATSKDTVILNYMYIHGKNFASDEMHTFHRLIQKYYKTNLNSGWFLDIGANIGTTSVYIAKNISPNLKILAFEPEAENYRLLRINLLLNKLEEKVICENVGLGIENKQATMYRNLENPGANSLFHRTKDLIVEDIQITSLDAYLKEKKIEPKEVKCIWIDTEGFEAQVLLGAKELLEKNPAPIFLEFNPTLWEKSGYFDEMTELLAKHYSHFIIPQESIRQGTDKPYPINEFRSLSSSLLGIDIFFIANYSS